MCNINNYKCILTDYRLANKTNELKVIYGELLRKSSDTDDFSHLLRVVTQISELSF